MEIICENMTTLDGKESRLMSFVPFLRSGEWSDIGSRQYMEDTHVSIADLAKNFGHHSLDREAISFYGVFDGHGEKGAANYVCDNLPRVIVEDSDFPQA